MSTFGYPLLVEKERHPEFISGSHDIEDILDIKRH